MSDSPYIFFTAIVVGTFLTIRIFTTIIIPILSNYIFGPDKTAEELDAEKQMSLFQEGEIEKGPEPYTNQPSQEILDIVGASGFVEVNLDGPDTCIKTGRMIGG